MVENTKVGPRSITACAAGVLLAISACSSSDGNSGATDSDGEGSEETVEVDPVSSEIRSWEGVCDVFDPDSIATELGAEYVEDGPVEVGLDEGTFLGALSCNALFIPESDPDQSQGFMYMNLYPSNGAESAKELYDEIWEDEYSTHNNQDPTAQVMLATEEDLEGDWDEAAIFATAGGMGDRVWAYYLKGSYLVQIQLSWGPDSEIQAAELDGEDISEAAQLAFTPMDIGNWVIDTYLPQTYDAIEAKIAEGTGE
ncbi:hypothetical protein GCM10029992_08710 [Glycomyces albus]